MDVDTRTWLVNFECGDIPFMSATEILHQIAALREIEDAPHCMWRLPVAEENRGFVARSMREKLNGNAGFVVYLYLIPSQRRTLEVQRSSHGSVSK